VESKELLIKVEDLVKVYSLGEVKVEALRGISFYAKKTEFIAIMGASGSGKSTFMNIIGLLDEPTRGKYLLLNRDVSSLKKDERAYIRNRMIGFVFQNFNLLPRTTAYENVLLPLLYSRDGKRDHRDRVMSALSLVGIEDRANHFPTQLSGGEQQRVAIARALINDPPLILADEPTGNLDSSTSKEIMELFQNLNEDRSITIILVTHEADIASFAKRRIYFRDGLIEREDGV
jgi:putative ABC transport system ATP-binding protein